MREFTQDLRIANAEIDSKKQAVKLKAGVNSIQKLSNDNTPIVVELPKIDSKEGGIDFRLNDKVLIEATIINLERFKKFGYIELEYDPGCISIEVETKHIKKHIPQKSEVEIAEEELEEATNNLIIVLNNDETDKDDKEALDRYYQARKTLETLKAKNI